MSYKDLADLIPMRYQRRIVEENIVFQAVALPENVYIQALGHIWYTCIETDKEFDSACSICLGNVLHNFNELLPFIVENVKAQNLLDL